MKYEKIYKDNLDYEMNIILNLLKESFIEFYGISNKDKIEKVFKDLTITYMTENKSAIEFNKTIKELETIYNTIKNTITKEHPKAKEKEIINLAFNDDALVQLKELILSLSFNKLCLSKKKNDTSLNILLGHNKVLLSKKYKDLITNYLNHSTMGFSITYPITTKMIVIRLKENGQIPLHTLIHEINHQLQKDILSLIKGYKIDDAITVKGITNKSDDLVNEILNDYCSLDIMQIFLKKYNSTLLDTNYLDGYIYLDQLSGNAMNKTYNLLKEEIKTRLINGNAQTIRYLIDGNDKYNYILLNQFYKKLLDKVLTTTNKNRKFYIPRKKKKELHKYTHNKYITIKNNYNTYITYTNNLTNTVNNMINKGQAKKLSLN